MTVAETLVAGRYRIGPCLGTGGMGRVWLARDEVLRRDVAIKEIALPFGLTDEEREEMRERTLREARAAARLSHPNVVRIYDVQHGDERPWIVMEYVPARSLLQVIKENGPLPPKDVAGIGLAVLAALDAADRAGVVHRDVKPSNVLIADDGRVLLTDFGAAMIDEGEGALTQTGIILGSPRYIAPERAATGISTLESDLWSLGATLYEAVEGRGPYTRETTLAVLVALATEKPDPVDRAGPLKPVINGLLQKNPKARMRLPEVEQRLRRIADVQNAVRLHQVPMPRFGEMAPPALTPAADRDTGSISDGVVVKLDSLPVPAVPSRPPAAAAAPSSAPPTPQSPAAAPSRPAPIVPPRRRHKRAWLAGLAAAVVVLAGAAVYAVTEGVPWAQDARLTSAEAASNGGAPAAPSSAARTSAAAPAALPTTLPGGYSWYSSKSGFRVAWPTTWVKIQESRTSVTLCNPGGPPVVAVREWIRPDPDLQAALRREETAANLPSYKRLRMNVAPQQDSAEWEYTFTDPKMGPLHGVDRAVIVGSRAYLITWRTPAAEWSQHRERFRVVASTFQPAPPATATRAVPVGYSAYQSRAGAFHVISPAKWAKIEESPTSVVFCAPGGPPVVGVRRWTPSNADLAVALRAEEAKLDNMPRYRRISIETLPGQQGAIWEYTFTDPQMGRLHGVDRAFVTPNGAYIVQWRTPADKWSSNLPKLGTIMSHFRGGAV
jgi:eukaryotic-like serine/threonine-protein kinase